MITLISAEKIAQSKTALLVCLIVAVIWLASINADLSKKNDQWKIDYDEQAARHAKTDREKDSTIYDCKQQQKIDANNATQAEKRRAEKYEILYNQVMEIKEAAKLKRIIE